MALAVEFDAQMSDCRAETACSFLLLQQAQSSSTDADWVRQPIQITASVPEIGFQSLRILTLAEFLLCSQDPN